MFGLKKKQVIFIEMIPNLSIILTTFDEIVEIMYSYFHVGPFSKNIAIWNVNFSMRYCEVWKPSNR